jgi:hypothetical protein
MMKGAKTLFTMIIGQTPQPFNYYHHGRWLASRIASKQNVTLEGVVAS